VNCKLQNAYERLAKHFGLNDFQAGSVDEPVKPGINFVGKPFAENRRHGLMRGTGG
jgi:hypothetical protein